MRAVAEQLAAWHPECKAFGSVRLHVREVVALLSDVARLTAERRTEAESVAQFLRAWDAWNGISDAFEVAFQKADALVAVYAAAEKVRAAHRFPVNADDARTAGPSAE